MKTKINTIVLILMLVSTATIKAGFNDLVDRMSSSKNVIKLIENSVEIINQKDRITKQNNSFERIVSLNKFKELLQGHKDNYNKVIEEFPEFKEINIEDKKEVFKKINLNRPTKIPNALCISEALFTVVPTCLNMDFFEKEAFDAEMLVASSADAAEIAAQPELAPALAVEINTELVLAAEVATFGQSLSRIEKCADIAIEALRICFESSSIQ